MKILLIPPILPMFVVEAVAPKPLETFLGTIMYARCVLDIIEIAPRISTIFPLVIRETIDIASTPSESVRVAAVHYGRTR